MGFWSYLLGIRPAASRIETARALVEDSPEKALEILQGLAGGDADVIRSRARKQIRKRMLPEPPSTAAGPVDSDPYRSRPPRRRKRKQGS